MKSRTKEMYFTDETRQMLEKNWSQSHISGSEYLELLIRREYQKEHPGVFCEKIEETAQEIFSAISDLQELLSKEDLKEETHIEVPIRCLKWEIEKLQQYSKE